MLLEYWCLARSIRDLVSLPAAPCVSTSVGEASGASAPAWSVSGVHVDSGVVEAVASALIHDLVATEVILTLSLSLSPDPHRGAAHRRGLCSYTIIHVGH